MGNKNNSSTFIAQTADKAEQVSHFIQGEGGGGFIHNQNAGIDGKSARDFNHLLLSDAQTAGFLFQVKVYTKRFKQVARIGVQFSPINPPADCGWLSSYKNIFRHIQIGEKTQFLINRGDSHLTRFARISKSDMFSIEIYLTFIRLVNTCHHFYQRGFARPIFTKQGMNFTRTQ